MAELEEGSKEQQKRKKDKKKNPMRKVRIRKVILNISVGEQGEKLLVAAEALQQITGQKPAFTKAKCTIPSHGIRKNQKVAVHSTIRGEKAEVIFDKALKAYNYQLKNESFLDSGNIWFTLTDCTDFDLSDSPVINQYGLDIYVVLERPGFSVRYKKGKKHSRVGGSHCLKKEDTVKWLQHQYNGLVVPD